MDELTTAPQQEKKKRPRKFVWVLGLCALAALAAALFYFITQRSPEPVQYTPNVSVGAMPGGTPVEDLQAQMDAYTAETAIAYILNTTPYFEDGSAMGNLMISSPEVSVKPIQVVISRNDTGDVVYDSGALEPNSYIMEDVLQTAKPLPKGDYPCTAVILLLDQDTGKEIGRSEADMVITIGG